MKSAVGWTCLVVCLGLAAVLAGACMAAEQTKAPADKPAATPAASATSTAEKLAAPEKLSEEGFVPIFNGKDLTDWSGDNVHWSVRDGAIHGECTEQTKVTGGNTFLIWKGGKPADFELRLSAKLVGGNSGIQYRSFTPVTNPEKYFVGGYQMEISTDPKNAGFIYGELWRGIVMCGVGEKAVWKGGKQVLGSLGDKAEIASHYKKEDWNDYRIVAQGNHIDQYLNGIHVVDFTDEDPKALVSGVIALQIHQGYVMTVDFKDIRLKVFPKEGAAAKEGATGAETKPAK